MRVDASLGAHRISPLLFGDNFDWRDEGGAIWDTASNAPRPDLLAALAPLGLTSLRYPGGTLSDFFHWAEVVGPATMRLPQINPFTSTATNVVREPVVFGPDEFATLAGALNVDLHVLSPYWQAAVTSDASGRNPVRSAFGDVFRLYADTAGGTFVPAEVRDSPTFDAPGTFYLAARTGVPALDAIAVRSAAGDRLWVYVVNSDLYQDVAARVVLRNLSGPGVTSLTAEVLNGPAYTSVNTSADSTVVSIATSSLASTGAVSITFSAHSLTRLTVR